MPDDHAWTLDELIAIFVVDGPSRHCRFHLVGAKIGGTIARAFAARRPDRLITLTVVGTPPPFRVGTWRRSRTDRDFKTHGVEYWARQNMAGRLGASFPPEGVEWWTRFMGRTAVSTQIGFMGPIACADIARPAEDLLSDAGRRHRAKRARLGGRNPRLATANPRLGTAGAARQFVSRRRHPCRSGRGGDAGVHRAARPGRPPGFRPPAGLVRRSRSVDRPNNARN